MRHCCCAADPRNPQLGLATSGCHSAKLLRSQALTDSGSGGGGGGDGSGGGGGGDGGGGPAADNDQ
jgi:hypothetical protein